MSLAAMMWATDADRSGHMSPATRMVLTVLADYADGTGRGAYPSVGTIAGRLGLSERAVYMSLTRLETGGWVREGDQRLVDHIPANHRPVVRDLALAVILLPSVRGVKETSPQPEQAAEPVDNPPRGEVIGSAGVKETSPNPSTKPKTLTHLRLEGDTSARETLEQAAPDPGPRVRLLGDTSPTCPICGARIHRSHRCRSSAIDPPPPPTQITLPIIEPIPGQEALPLIDPGACLVCFTTPDHRPLIDGMCTPCYVASCRQATP